MSVPFIIGVAGGSGSGKTTLSKEIRHQIPSELVTHIPHDAYYRDQSHVKPADRKLTNYDHPNSLETDLLVSHLKQLKAGKTIIQPTYDFTNHTRAKETLEILSKPVIIVDGILIFSDKNLRDMIDLKIFVDTDSDLRLARRLVRDIAERGRTFEEGIEQYLTDTKPMHEQFVEPSKRFADIIVPEGGLNTMAIDMIRTQIKSILKISTK